MTDRLFKLGSVADELMTNMEKELSSIQKDNKIAKVSKAFDYLNYAAELFDDVGRIKEAEVITKLIEKMASDDIPEVFEIKSLLHDTEEKSSEEPEGKLLKFKSLLHKEKPKSHPGDELFEFDEKDFTKKKV
jgi:hypothetical protein